MLRGTLGEANDRALEEVGRPGGGWKVPLARRNTWANRTTAACFSTEYGEPEAQEGRRSSLFPRIPESADLQLSRWGRAANLSHPNLARIFQTGRCQLGDERLLYIVMECGDEDLSQIIPQRPLTPAEAQDMLRPVLDALAYLHAKGFAHGRVKPSNIMAVDDQLRLSSDGICAIGEMKIGRGKPSAYDAPEAATRGQFPAGDAWSLGMTLAEILTQQASHMGMEGTGGSSAAETIAGAVSRYCAELFAPRSAAPSNGCRHRRAVAAGLILCARSADCQGSGRVPEATQHWRDRRGCSCAGHHRGGGKNVPPTLRHSADIGGYG